MSLLETLEQWDVQLFLKLNGQHNSFFDVLMYWISYKFTAIPLYALLLWLVIKKFGWDTWKVLLAIVALIVLTDQFSTHLFKNIFLRYRPCHNYEIKHLVHTLNGYCGGTYGFVSSHAANTFGLAVFINLLFKKRAYWWLYVWAAIVCYSRIYAGVHYPADVVVGALVGTLLGIAVWKILELVFNRTKK